MASHRKPKQRPFSGSIGNTGSGGTGAAGTSHTARADGGKGSEGTGPAPGTSADDGAAPADPSSRAGRAARISRTPRAARSGQSHRAPLSVRTSRTVRTAATLALAGAATATVFDGTGHAEPRPTLAQVKEGVDRYHREAEQVTEKYNGSKKKAEQASRKLDALRDEAARKTARLNASRNALGAIATAQYRSGSVAPTLQLALSSSPGEYLERASLADRAGSRQATTISGIAHQKRALQQVRTEAGDRLEELRGAKTALARDKRIVEKKLGAAELLMEKLSREQRRRLLARDGDGSATLRSGPGTPPHGPTRALTARAARAVSYAYSALGRPYVWGATGPSGYDCSGLTQAAWKAAGVAIPRTSYTQINAGHRVSRSELAPGDLVFFYSGISHVGIYIGGGKMIHASRPGTPVRIASVDDMPLSGAARPS